MTNSGVRMRGSSRKRVYIRGIDEELTLVEEEAVMPARSELT